MGFIHEAYYNSRSYSPEEWKTKKELRNKSKKDGKLTCASGCRVTLVNGCNYITSNGTPVYRCTHFRHVNASANTTCKVLKKYGHNGESKEHLNTKRIVASMDVVFARTCHYSKCINKIECRPDPTWTSKMEVRLDKWLFDVVYFENDTVKVVIEVMHTHATVGEKRLWAMQQPFEFIEVRATESKYLHVIDIKGEYLCGGDICPTLNEYVRLQHKRKCDYEERQHAKKRQYQNERVKKCVNRWKTMGRNLQLRYNRVLRRYCRLINMGEKERRGKERASMLEEDMASKAMGYLYTMGSKFKGYELETEWEREWKSFGNKENTVPYGELKGCDVYQVIYAYPHLINLICGHAGKNRLKDKYSSVYQNIMEITNGMVLKEKHKDKYIKRRQFPYKWRKYYPAFHEALVQFANDRNNYHSI